MADPIELEGAGILDLDARLMSELADKSLAWVPVEDDNVDPHETVRVDIADLIAGVTATAFTTHASSLPAEPLSVGFHYVQSGTSRGLYFSNGVKTYALTQFEEDGI